ncbi:MAG TPA: hypothetical protein VGF69_07635 [Thermoanaerobaculia bacterium]|jgi:hypothetical protein
MAANQRVIVAGAGGVFGRLLVRELTGKFHVVAATRRELDLNDVEAVRRMAKGAYAIACTAGPFQALDRRIVRACVEAGAHWLDIGDDARWFFDLLDDRELDALARERGVAVLPGLSTLPAVSGALVRRLGSRGPVKVTLRINNRNAKGAAAIASAAAAGGRSLNSPDRELFRRELGLEVEAVVEFEAPFASAVMRPLQRLPLPVLIRLGRIIARLAKPFAFGKPGGWLEARDAVRALRINTPDQRIAVLPLVFALEHLGGISGCHAPRVFDGEQLLRSLERTMGQL